eukprot:7380790-Prymnesium_polylepis.2
MPPGSSVLTPETSTSSPPANATALPPLPSQASTGWSPCRWSATWRAVGWSKISVLDSTTPSPADRCSWFRSSTAPKESTPASINGASASTALPAVLFTISSTASSEIVGACRRGADAQRGASGAITLRNEGTAPPLSTRCHCTGSTARFAGPCGSIAACRAPSPCARPIRPKPFAASIAAIRALAAPRAAIPTSAHAPHCTLTPACERLLWPPPPSSAATDEKSAHARRGAAEHARCSIKAPWAFGVHTRASIPAACLGSMPSARTPAACHTPCGLNAPRVSEPSIRTSCASAASHGHASTAAAVADSSCQSVAALLASFPLRERRASALAPCCATQRAVSSPRPAVPPVIK